MELTTTTHDAHLALKDSQGDYKKLTDAQLEALISGYPAQVKLHIYSNAVAEFYTRARGIALVEQEAKRVSDRNEKIKSIQPQMDIVNKMVRGSLVRYQFIKFLLGDTDKIRGRFPQPRAKCIDYTNKVTSILIALEIPYETGNDAPRGGACGWFAKRQGE